MLKPMAAASSLARKPSSRAYWGRPVAAIFRPVAMYVPSVAAPLPPRSVPQARNRGVGEAVWRAWLISRACRDGSPAQWKPPMWYRSTSSWGSWPGAAQNRSWPTFSSSVMEAMAALTQAASPPDRR